MKAWYFIKRHADVIEAFCTSLLLAGVILLSIFLLLSLIIVLVMKSP